MGNAKMSNRSKSGEVQERKIRHYFPKIKSNGAIGCKSKFVTHEELNERLGYEIDLTKKK